MFNRLGKFETLTRAPAPVLMQSLSFFLFFSLAKAHGGRGEVLGSFYITL